MLHVGGGRRSIVPYNTARLGLLDAIGVSATAAYGLRRLRRSYRGMCCNIRRSSDNATKDIGFNGRGDFSIDQFLGFVGSGSGFVAKWYDQSGNGNDASQATAANQPQLVLNATGRGRPALIFAGAQFLETSGAWTGASAPQTFVAYAKCTDSVSEVNNIFGTPGSPNNGTPALIFFGSVSSAALQGSANLSAAAANGAYHSLIGVVNGASSSLTVDGATTTGNAGTIFTTGVITIGAQSISHGNKLTGNISEIIGANGALSAAQIAALANSEAGYF